MLEESALRRSLDALSSFFVGHATMSDTLHRVSELAIQAVPAAKFIGLTMMVDATPATAVFTDPESPEIDQAQYASGSGPCMDAFASGEIRLVKSTRQDTTWPEFSQACLDHGILSTMSLPLAIANGPLGAMNFYADTDNAFNGPEIETATLFASQASIVLANSQAYWDARSLGEQLSESIASRSIIEQAKGIIMGSMRCNAEQAFNYLVHNPSKPTPSCVSSPKSSSTTPAANDTRATEWAPVGIPSKPACGVGSSGRTLSSGASPLATSASAIGIDMSLSLRCLLVISSPLVWR